MDCSTPGFPVLHCLPEFAQTHVHWVRDAIQPSHPLLSLLLLPSIFPSISIFLNESALLIRWSKYQSFSFSISLYKAYWLVWCPCSPKESQASSPIPHFKSINSLEISLLYGSKNLLSIHAEEGVDRRELSYNVCGNVNWYSHYGKQYGGASKT